MNMNRISVIQSLLLVLILTTLLAGCSGNSGSSPSPGSPVPLAADNINLIFVVSPDLAYQTPGDINPDTANLTNQGLQRSLLMATYLKTKVLGSKNVTSIYSLAPITHLQTANNYPDMAAIGYIQQFALLNQITLPVSDTATYNANSYPINVAYAKGSVPNGAIVQLNGYCPNCTGLDFNNANGNNDLLITSIINGKIPGFYVFSAPWETVSALLAKINNLYGNNLNLPATYMGSNYIYAISIPIPSPGIASLYTYNSNLNPPATYPVLPSPVATTSCTYSQQPYFKAVWTGGVDGVTVPANSNKNQTVYIVRHADAHPDPDFAFEDGNYVGAGQWRALSLSNALRGKMSPNMVYSIDPAQWYTTFGPLNFSYVRPSLTVLPYAIANNLPFNLVAKFSITDTNTTDPAIAQATSDFFFTNGTFSNQAMLVAWESGHIRPFLNSLMASYGGNNPPQLPTAGPPVGGWPHPDYDTIWTVTLDAQGNLTVDNALCEGIDSTQLPAQAPLF
ncbi:MAG: hypothetical protein CSYNP_03509 [Syntrophus sp. SKADARSKE-3]|nr:hypothetical protein [Syntrophus sp. SKADARSKE-3]